MSFRPSPTPDPTTGLYNPRDFAFPDPYPVYGCVLVSILVAVTFGVYCFIMYRLIKYRNNRLIQPRCMATFLPMLTVTYLNMVVFCVSMMIGKPMFCYTLDALYLITPVLALHYNFNIPALVFQSELNAKKLERGHSGEDSYEVKWLRLTSVPFRFLYLVISGFCAVGIFLILKFFANMTGDCNREAQLTTAIIVLSLVVILSYFLVKISKVRDPYFMKLENDVGTIVTFPAIFLMIAYPVGPAIFGDWFDYRWSFVFTSITNIYFNGMFEAMLTFDWFVQRLEKLKGGILPEEQIKETDTLGSIFALSQGMDLFQAVLSNTTMVEGFTQFALKEWSVENVLFYKGVEEFKELWSQDPKQAQAFASMLVREYIVIGAPLEVNLDHVVRKNIMKEVNEEGLSQSTFDHAQKCIYDLMKKDSFEKWRKTANFKETIQKLVTLRRSNESDSTSKGSHEGSKGSQHTELRMKVHSGFE